MANEAVDITEKLSLFSEHWSPKVVARLNDYEIKVVGRRCVATPSITVTPTWFRRLWVTSISRRIGRERPRLENKQRLSTNGWWGTSNSGSKQSLISETRGPTLGRESCLTET